jgi:hypothetical protein
VLDFLKAAVTFFPVCAVFCKSVVFVEVHRRLRVSVKSVTQPIGISDGFGVIATAWRRSAAVCADVGPVWAGGSKLARSEPAGSASCPPRSNYCHHTQPRRP